MSMHLQLNDHRKFGDLELIPREWMVDDKLMSASEPFVIHATCNLYRAHFQTPDSLSSVLFRFYGGLVSTCPDDDGDNEYDTDVLIIATNGFVLCFRLYEVCICIQLKWL